MFSGLKNKLKSFLGKKEKPSKADKEKSKPAKKETKKPEKVKEIKEQLPSDNQLKEQAQDLEEPQVEFNPGTQKYEPVLDQEKEIPAKPGFFSKIIKGTTSLKKEHVDEILEPLELILLENNVNLSTIDKIKQDLEKDLVGIEIKKSNIQETIQESLKKSIQEVLIEPPNLLEAIKKKNKTSDIYTIVFFGINGSGKTTSIAKLASKLQKAGIKPVLAAADTFRAASIEQLKTHGNKLKIPVIAHDYGSDPAAVAFDAKAYATKHKLQVVLIDTAGRMYTKSNLLKEMEKIIRISKPDLKIFVAESITGNDATEQASTFNEEIGIDGIILTKSDVDEKGGAALSVSQVTGKPIYFLGTGQEYSDLKDFSKKDIIKNLGLD